MKILVTVKEVAAVADDFEIEGLEIPETYLEYDLNEWDDYAIEAAVRIAEDRDEEVEVVAVTLGPERSEETIRMALAKGVDRAVRVWDDALAEADVLDPTTTARIIAAVAEREDPDLVLSGVQAADDGFGATGVALADLLDMGWAAVVNDLELGEGEASVRRELEGGVEELTTVDLPAVLTIQTGINEPRYASLRGIRQAQRKELAVHSLADLDLDPAVVDDALTLTRLAKPETESDATIFEGDPGETAAELETVLRDAGVGAE
ncbi:electron transfer flavoprotein subunit beta/FixA family protein [Haloplanus aerogenes]|uniref:Electron transfer flavoprotein beta subunit n=1 Tax=Haloplanus aerogenes TaxID=660522 RepID=A0A3M0DVV7_9EURY|nr:electron transfer flavoprotein subunit beta/FixA family protein [Haloplanus aerogenes]AZH24454.1 electron transfer flavoprotein subunit beta/FixA family protein [Haloplanus aerogenes]RMB23899.1 electron transfer flavoprotein beta subunit [Haloplanus aerogenes]